MDFPALDLLVHWITEREAVRHRREAGHAPPWTGDEPLATYRFCNVNVQDDHVSRAIHKLVTRPHADDPGLIVALAVCRFTNAPEVIEAVRDCLVPFDAERFVAIMTERAARGLPLERRAYVIPGGVPGELKAASLARDLFTPLANAIEQIRPKAGDTCQAVFERLRRFPYLNKGFITAQIIRDLKQVEPLRSAPDWHQFVMSGPGSQRGVNRILGATTQAEIDRVRPEAEWRDLFREIVDIAAPQVAEHGIVGLDAQSWQNCACEVDKWICFRSGDLRGARQFRSEGAKHRPRKPSTPAPSIEPLAPVPRALPALAAARDPAAAHVLHCDLETRSAVDLQKSGAQRYAEDPSTDALCCAYGVDDEPVQLWARGDPVPAEFIEAAHNPKWLATAHNAAFERPLFEDVLAPRYGFPLIPVDRWRCTMAQALACSLPGKLEKLGEVLGLPVRKDAEGARLLRLLSRPLPDGTWIEDPALLERLYAYCVRDVEVERAAHHRLPPLSDSEQVLWMLDATINGRGFYTDGALLEAAAHLATTVDQAMQEEITRITAGAVPKTSQVAKLQAFLTERGAAI